MRFAGRIPLPVFAAADAAAATPTLGADEMQRRTAAARDFATRLGEIVGLLMRSRSHRHTMLAELEWMVLPALAHRQVRIAEGTSGEAGIATPIAVVLWASVSAEVDQRLNQSIDLPIRLKPDEWRCGDIIWIVEAVGEQRAVTATLEHLKQNEFKDSTVRLRVKGKDGQAMVGRLEVEPGTAKG